MESDLAFVNSQLSQCAQTVEKGLSKLKNHELINSIKKLTSLRILSIQLKSLKKKTKIIQYNTKYSFNFKFSRKI